MHPGVAEAVSDHFTKRIITNARLEQRLHEEYHALLKDHYSSTTRQAETQLLNRIEDLRTQNFHLALENLNWRVADGTTPREAHSAFSTVLWKLDKPHHRALIPTRSQYAWRRLGQEDLKAARTKSTFFLKVPVPDDNHTGYLVPW